MEDEDRYTTRLYTLLSTLHHLPNQPPFTQSPDTVAFTDVDVAVPGRSGDDSDSDGMILIRDLSFTLRIGAGEHLMITGTNGVGNTAIARVVAGLWAGQAGEYGADSW